MITTHWHGRSYHIAMLGMSPSAVLLLSAQSPVLALLLVSHAKDLRPCWSQDGRYSSASMVPGVHLEQLLTRSQLLFLDQSQSLSLSPFPILFLARALTPILVLQQ